MLIRLNSNLLWRIPTKKKQSFLFHCKFTCLLIILRVNVCVYATMGVNQTRELIPIVWDGCVKGCGRPLYTVYPKPRRCVPPTSRFSGEDLGSLGCLTHGAATNEPRADWGAMRTFSTNPKEREKDKDADS
jgi:hypothetical protein